ncbi:polysaccharide lyase [Rhodobacteraceae bacterium]|nr:polysaccharide lyase [Paracoccaceae bacterium]
MFNINRRSFAIGSLATLAMGCQQTTTLNVINATSVDNGIISRNPNFLNKQRGRFNDVSLNADLKPYNYQVMQDFTGLAPTRYIERFELRDGDCFNEDCKTERERSEVIVGNSGRYGEEFWYQMYFYVPNDFHIRNTHCNVAFNFPVTYKDGRWRNTALITPIMGGTESVTRHYAMVYNGRKRERILMKPYQQMKGRWTKIELNTLWHENGFHRFYFNDELVVDYKGYTLGEDAKSEFHWKYGLYRGANISAKKRKYNMDIYPTQWAAYSAVRASKTRQGWV